MHPDDTGQRPWLGWRTELKLGVIEVLKILGLLTGFIGFMILWVLGCVYFADTTNPFLLFMMNFFGVCGGLG
jgi:hypothetical protein